MNKKIPIWVLIIPIVLFIVIGFSGKSFYKDYKNELTKQMRVNDSIIEVSKFKEDSLINLSNEQIKFADQLRTINNNLQRQNNNLYYELKKRRKEIFVVDNDFNSNAKRIAESSNRFYKENDTIR